MNPLPTPEAVREMYEALPDHARRHVANQLVRLKIKTAGVDALRDADPLLPPHLPHPDPADDYAHEELKAFQEASDHLLSLAWWTDNAKFNDVFIKAMKDYSKASMKYSFALSEYANTVPNPQLREVYSERADDVLLQQRYFYKVVAGFRNRGKHTG